MENEKANLNTLSTLYYVNSGITALFSLLPSLYILFGIVILFLPAEVFQEGSNEEQLPVAGIYLMSGFMIVVGLLFCSIILAYSVLCYHTGKQIRAHKNNSRCLIFTAISCIGFPFGTALGVITLFLINKPEYKQVFSDTNTALGEKITT